MRSARIRGFSFRRSGAATRLSPSFTTRLRTWPLVILLGHLTPTKKAAVSDDVHAPQLVADACERVRSVSQTAAGVSDAPFEPLGRADAHTFFSMSLRTTVSA